MLKILIFSDVHSPTHLSHRLVKIYFSIKEMYAMLLYMYVSKKAETWEAEMKDGKVR